MNNEKKQAPRCPYCGAEMRNENSVGCIDNPRYWYRCTNKGCGSTSPDKSTWWNAYRAAMTRCETPNRVLTWEEVCAACDVPEWVLLWREWNVKDAALYVEQICPAYELNNEDVVFVSPGDETEGRYNKAEYGKRLRCWIRKPTMNEMENTPWEESDNE